MPAGGNAHPAGILRQRAFALMQRLDSALVRYQDRDLSSPDYGGIRCPGCGLYHTRSAEAVWPLSYEYALTGDGERLRQAIDLACWLIARQREDGAWEETPETWTGTTTDQLLMLLLSYPIVEKSLTARQRRSWLRSMERAADYLTGFIDNRHASMNYCCTTAATLAEAWLRLGKPVYRLKARCLAAMAVAKMDAEGFPVGEGERIGEYRYGVDIGYNLEMSLWGLARYASLLGDEPVLDAVRKSASTHLMFLYPDGMLDASAGTRSNKWTVYGSGTSDGCHPLFALLSEGHPEYISAAVRNMDCIGTCFTECGLLGLGPDYDAIMDTPPCIYPTFTKAKSMAMAHCWVTGDTDTLAGLPLDRDTLARSRSLNLAVVRRGPFCATVTAYGYKSGLGTASKNMFRPTGGAMSVLWAEGYGLVQASSQTEYHRWEPMSFPEMGELEPLTPRLEQVREDTLFTNLFEFDATFDTFEEECRTVCAASGLLRSRDQIPCGTLYSMRFSFGGETLTKTYFSSGDACVRIVEPVVMDDGTVLEQRDGFSVVLRRGGVALELRSSVPLEVSGPVCRQVYPALRALPLIMNLSPGEEVTLVYRLLK